MSNTHKLPTREPDDYLSLQSLSHKVAVYDQGDHWAFTIKLKDGDTMVFSEMKQIHNKVITPEYKTIVYYTLLSGLCKKYAHSTR